MYDIEILDNIKVDRYIKVKIDNINQGFNKYIGNILDFSNYTFEEAFDKYNEIFNKEYELFGNVFIFDFYKENLTEKSIQIIKNNLDEEDFKIIEYIYNNSIRDYHFYQSNDLEVLRALLKLSLNELYFITFYFKESTIWSNYNKKFILFKEK